MTAARSSSMRVRLPLRHSPPPGGAPSLGLRVMQWLLVLLLAWDQVGSPLHHHHHDSGIDGSALTTSHDGAVDALHVEDADAGLQFSHAVMAVRPQSQVGKIVAAETDDAVLAQVGLALVFAARVADPQHVPAPDPGPPAHSLHRSLPPAGRAPPLHA